MGTGQSGLFGVSPGRTSMSLTIQSESVPVVDAYSVAMMEPAMVTSSVSTSDSYTNMSGRVAAKRWSSIIHR